MGLHASMFRARKGKGMQACSESVLMYAVQAAASSTCSVEVAPLGKEVQGCRWAHGCGERRPAAERGRTMMSSSVGAYRIATSSSSSSSCCTSLMTVGLVGKVLLNLRQTTNGASQSLALAG